METVATTRPGGSGRRRLTPEREAELYETVLEILREVGYEALTMDAVATRTRCSKATLYRQWAGKPELVAKALRHAKPVILTDIDTGTLRGDFRAMVDQMDHRRLAQDSALMRGLFQAIHTHTDLRQALRDLFVNPELGGLDAMLARAATRGEISSGSAVFSYVPHMMIGAMITHQLIEDCPADPEFLLRYIDAVVLPALGA